MPNPLAICIEDLDPNSEADRFLRCVAKAGRGDGLALDSHGHPRFGDLCGVACELVVSLDERLLLVRREGAPRVIVRRAGRCLAAPAGQRVVLVDQDTIEVGPRRLRVHIHGFALEVHAPRPFVPKSLKTAASVAAVVAMGVGTSGCKEIASLFDGGPIDVRMSPPEPPPAPPVPDAGASSAAKPAASGPRPGGSTPAESASSSASADSKPPPKPAPIEVRDNPPEYAPEVPSRK